MPKKKNKRSAAFRRRSAAAKKGWKTRRARAHKDKPRVEEDKKTAQMVLAFLSRADVPENRRPQLESLIENNFGKKGFDFDVSGGILKISISTKKTRKKFSVRR